MIIDGKAIAQDILLEVAREVATLSRPPRLTVFTCAPNFETQKFLALKERRAREVGIEVTVVTLPEICTTAVVMSRIMAAVPDTDGIIVQLPFPVHIDANAILLAIPANYDVDALRYEGEVTDVLPPVIGAIDMIATRHAISFNRKSVVVVGQGRLVGKPAALYAASHGGIVTILEKETRNAAKAIREADILILGAGVPGLVTAEMIKPGVVIFDAATSEEGGVLVGDATPDVADVASLLTPVPGGIGPITVALLLQNLLRLASTH